MFWFFFKSSPPQNSPPQEKLRIGEILYSVHEHLYYDKSVQAAPLTEFIIVEGKVVRFIKGDYTQAVIHAEVDHILRVYYYKISDLEKRLFRRYEDAVGIAVQKTENFERAWGWCVGKLRRPWEIKRGCDNNGND